MILLVRIIKCSGPNFWYADSVGVQFRVVRRGVNQYVLVSDPLKLIRVEDCKIIKAEIDGNEYERFKSVEKRLNELKLTCSTGFRRFAPIVMPTTAEALPSYENLKKKHAAYMAEKQDNDAVNKPAHYTDGKIEVIDFIEDKKLNFHKGNAVKYIARAGKKDPAKTMEDLKKARWYIDREIERLEGGKCAAGTVGCAGKQTTIREACSRTSDTTCSGCGEKI